MRTKQLEQNNSEGNLGGTKEAYRAVFNDGEREVRRGEARIQDVLSANQTESVISGSQGLKQLLLQPLCTVIWAGEGGGGCPRQEVSRCNFLREVTFAFGLVVHLDPSYLI